MQRSALNAQAAIGQGDEPESVVVHVQLRPRRGATRKCLAALAALAAEHPEVAFGVTGLSKDDRVVRVTVGIDLCPRAAVAKFSPQAQAAYAFVSDIFATLYDHMPVYTAEPSGAERAAAAVLLESAGGGTTAADVLEALPVTPAAPVPAPRLPGAGERIPA
ncbi:MAG: hypothetical protein ACXVX0_05800 [Blastococcus sp.]